jgi:hypothetical protein
VCTGDLYECSAEDGADFNCEPIEADVIETPEH